MTDRWKATIYYLFASPMWELNKIVRIAITELFYLVASCLNLSALLYIDRCCADHYALRTHRLDPLTAFHIVHKPRGNVGQVHGEFRFLSVLPYIDRYIDTDIDRCRFARHRHRAKPTLIIPAAWWSEGDRRFEARARSGLVGT